MSDDNMRVPDGTFERIVSELSTDELMAIAEVAVKWAVDRESTEETEKFLRIALKFATAARKAGGAA